MTCIITLGTAVTGGIAGTVEFPGLGTGFGFGGGYVIGMPSTSPIIPISNHVSVGSAMLAGYVDKREFVEPTRMTTLNGVIANIGLFDPEPCSNAAFAGWVVYNDHH